MPEKTHEAGFPMTPGRLLMAAREACGLSQADIAKQTRLSSQAIHDLEQDAYEQFGAVAFVRGYLRTYARIVGVSESQILEVLETSGLIATVSHSHASTVEGAPVLNVTHPQAQFRYVRWGAIGVGLLVVCVGLTLWHTQKTDAKKNVAEKNALTIAVSTQPAQSIQPIAVAQTQIQTQTQLEPSLQIETPVATNNTAPVVTNKTVKKIAKNEKKAHLSNAFTTHSEDNDTANLKPNYRLSTVTQ